LERVQKTSHQQPPPGALSQGQKIEMIGVLQHLLRHVRLVLRGSTSKIRLSLPWALEKLSLNLRDPNCTHPLRQGWVINLSRPDCRALRGFALTNANAIRRRGRGGFAPALVSIVRLAAKFPTLCHFHARSPHTPALRSPPPGTRTGRLAAKAHLRNYFQFPGHFELCFAL
jgi:hypothetical protein